jgi:hypothetical protein
MDRSALRAGRTYGLIGGGISLVMAAFGIFGFTSRSVGPLSGLAGFLSLVLAIFYLLTYVLAGRVAAMQTGKVSTGALAGLVAYMIATLPCLVSWSCTSSRPT